METPLISIVLTLYNKAPYIEETLFSIYKQTYTNRELIIVDDCSTDGSFEIAKSFCEKIGITEKCKFIQNEKNLRVAKTFERGLQETKGDWISMCDGDDILMKNKLEENLKFCQEKNIDFCHSDLTTIDENNNIINDSRIKQAHLNVNNKEYDKLIYGGNATGSSIFFAKKIGDKLKKYGFPRDIPQDRWILVYTSINQYNIGFIEKSLVYYRRCKSCISRGFFIKKTKKEIVEGRKRIFSYENSCCNYIIDHKIYMNNKQKKRCVNHVLLNDLLINFIDSKKIIISFKLLRKVIYIREFENYYRLLVLQSRKILSWVSKIFNFSN